MEKFVKIKENYEFRRAYKRGGALVSPYAVIYVFKTKGSRVRLGITVGKKIGKAVKRNRAKRVITAAFRQLLSNIKEGYDFVIVARTRILTVKSTVLQEKIEKLLGEADLLVSTENDE